eukprot:c32868_g1_i1 orf=62-709(+)
MEEGKGKASSISEVVGSQFCSSKEEVVLHLWQGCSFDAHVTQADGQPLFSLRNPPCLSFHGPKLILRDSTTPTHVPLLCTKRKCWSLKKKTTVFRGESSSVEGASLVFSVTLARVFQLSTNLHVFLETPFGNSSPSKGTENRGPDYIVKATCFTNDLTILRNDGTIVATAKRNFSFWCFVCFKPDYTITVYRGVDQAFIALLVAIQDNLNRNIHG